MLALQLGTPEEFAAVHKFLVESGYTEQAICERLGIAAIHELVGKVEATWPDPGDHDPAGLLAALFLLNQSFPAAKLESVFQPGVVGALESLGLLIPAATPASLRASMALYPAYGLYFISDLWISVKGAPHGMPTDMVFPAVGPNTLDFTEILPEERCEDFLELCSGTGVAALVAASKYARRAWAVDITERATRCAEFSRRLNGLTRVSVLQGDLYAPVAGRRFDRIVAHPPYVPALKPDKIYCDGGPDGQRIAEAMVRDLARHLKPGGRFYCLTMGVEQEGRPFERRVRQWITEGGADLDVLFVVHKTLTPAEFARQATISDQGDRRLMRRWIAHLESLGITNLVLGTLVIRQGCDGSAGMTLRRETSARSGRAEVEWLMRWESSPPRCRDLEWMLGSRPAFSPEGELRVSHRVRDGEFAPVQFTLQTDYPFSTECRVEAWMAAMLARCDGKTTVEEIFESCRRDDIIHPDAPIGEFVQLVRTLISGGFLLVEGFYPPRFQGGNDGGSGDRRLVFGARENESSLGRDEHGEIIGLRRD